MHEEARKHALTYIKIGACIAHIERSMRTVNATAVANEKCAENAILEAISQARLLTKALEQLRHDP